MKISKRDLIKTADGVSGFQPQPAFLNKKVELPGVNTSSKNPFADSDFEVEFTEHPNEDGVKVMAFYTHNDLADRIATHLSNVLNYVYHDPKYDFIYVEKKNLNKLKQDLKARKIYLGYSQR